MHEKEEEFKHNRNWKTPLEYDVSHKNWKKWIEAKESFQLIGFSFIKSSIKTELLAQKETIGMRRYFL